MIPFSGVILSEAKDLDPSVVTLLQDDAMRQFYILIFEF